MKFRIGLFRILWGLPLILLLGNQALLLKGVGLFIDPGWGDVANSWFWSQTWAVLGICFAVSVFARDPSFLGEPPIIPSTFLVAAVVFTLVIPTEPEMSTGFVYMAIGGYYFSASAFLLPIKLFPS
jgi:hypothetical protein